MKKWSNRAQLIEAGESARGRVGNWGILWGATNFFAVHMFCGVVLAMNDDQ